MALSSLWYLPTNPATSRSILEAPSAQARLRLSRKDSEEDEETIFSRRTFLIIARSHLSCRGGWRHISLDRPWFWVFEDHCRRRFRALFGIKLWPGEWARLHWNGQKAKWELLQAGWFCVKEMQRIPVLSSICGIVFRCFESAGKTHTRFSFAIFRFVSSFLKVLYTFRGATEQKFILSCEIIALGITFFLLPAFFYFLPTQSKTETESA